MFTNEDRIAGVGLLGLVMRCMGVVLSQSEDGNVIIMPGLGTVDRNGALLEEPMRMVVRALFSSLAMLGEWAQERH